MNIEKRIKRNILGRAGSFYIAVTPGLESVCMDELAALGVDMTNVSSMKGGIEFEDRVHACYMANLHLRTANRILMRIESIKATNFRQLEAKTAEIPWELYLNPDQPREIHVSSRRSRLFHTAAIADHLETQVQCRLEQMKSSMGQLGKRSDFTQQIFVRAADDRILISLDSSGDLLHKRGLKKNVGKAPMRETIAAAILLMAGYRPDEPLLDPMCGSGTFSMEAALIANRIPPGWHRNFAFMDWPCFKPTRWTHIRREAEKDRTHAETPLIFASDKSPDACRSFEDAIRGMDFAGAIAIANRNFLDLLPTDTGTGPGAKRRGMIVINPPYGRRIETTEESDRLFKEICRKLKRDFTGWKLALIARDRELAAQVPFPVNVRELLHGGLRLLLLSGRIS